MIPLAQLPDLPQPVWCRRLSVELQLSAVG